MRNSGSPGLWIAIFGPDGVGKSAVIEELQLQLGAGFHGVTHFHFRPGFRRSGRDLPPVTQPHAKGPRGRLFSLIKLVYWLADCWYGYLVAIRPCRRHSGLVIFDRYYPDILVDPVRYRLPSSCARVAGCLAALAPQPDLYVLLDAPAEVVQQRKRELPLDELQRQRVAYRKMVDRLHRRLIVDADCPVNEVARSISIALATLYQHSSAPEPSILVSLSTDRTNP